MSNKTKTNKTKVTPTVTNQDSVENVNNTPTTNTTTENKGDEVTKTEGTIPEVTVERKAGDKEVFAPIPNSHQKIKIPVKDFGNAEKKTVIATLPDGSKMRVIVVRLKGDKQGRPIDPNSERQQTLADRDARRQELSEMGITVGQGRPVDPNSKRQQDLYEKNIKTIQRIQSTDEYKKLIVDETFITAIRNTDEYKKLIGEGKKDEDLIAVAAIKKVASIVIRQGRPVNPGSERQHRLAAMDVKREQFGELKRGRPAQEILLSVDEDSIVEEEKHEEVEA